MKKVALLISRCDDGWIGGLNYYCNLLSQCHKYESDSVNITIVISPECKYKIQQMIPPDIAISTTSLVKRYSISWVIRNLIYVAMGRDFLMEKFLNRYDLEILTHSPCRIYGNQIKSIGWIPDMQHKYLPDFFSKKELNKREGEFERMLDRYDRVILSSQVAFDDVVRFYNVSKEKLAILRFYKQPAIPDVEISKDNLLKKYHIPGNFFFIPNQFWAHKNHSIVIEALNLFKLKNKQVVIVCSGNTQDYRNPDYFKILMKQVDRLDLRDNFKVIGLVPMADVNALIKHSMALINPSLFEGWSTSVEEARANGKRIILSDIPVHQEQSPPDAMFFKPDSAEELANCIDEIVTTYHPLVEELRREKAEINARALCAEFARQYANIVQSLT